MNAAYSLRLTADDDDARWPQLVTVSRVQVELTLDRLPFAPGYVLPFPNVGHVFDALDRGAVLTVPLTGGTLTVELALDDVSGWVDARRDAQLRQVWYTADARGYRFTRSSAAAAYALLDRGAARFTSVSTGSPFSRELHRLADGAAWSPVVTWDELANRAAAQAADDTWAAMLAADADADRHVIAATADLNRRDAFRTVSAQLRGQHDAQRALDSLAADLDGAVVSAPRHELDPFTADERAAYVAGLDPRADGNARAAGLTAAARAAARGLTGDAAAAAWSDGWEAASAAQDAARVSATADETAAVMARTDARLAALVGAWGVNHDNGLTAQLVGTDPSMAPAAGGQGWVLRYLDGSEFGGGAVAVLAVWTPNPDQPSASAFTGGPTPEDLADDDTDDGRHPFSLSRQTALALVELSTLTAPMLADLADRVTAAAAADGREAGEYAFSSGDYLDAPLSGEWADSPTLGDVLTAAMYAAAENTADRYGLTAPDRNGAIESLYGAMRAALTDEDADAVADAWTDGYRAPADAYPLHACTDCAQLAANGQTSADCDRTPAPLSAVPYGHVLVTGGTPRFLDPWTGCAGCGTRQAGDYWPAALVDTDPSMPRR